MYRNTDITKRKRSLFYNILFLIILYCLQPKQLGRTDLKNCGGRKIVNTVFRFYALMKKNRSFSRLTDFVGVMNRFMKNRGASVRVDGFIKKICGHQLSCITQKSGLT